MFTQLNSIKFRAFRAVGLALGLAFAFAVSLVADTGSAEARSSRPLIAQVDNRPFSLETRRSFSRRGFRSRRGFSRLGVRSRRSRVRRFRPRVRRFNRFERSFGRSNSLGGVFGISTGR